MSPADSPVLIAVAPNGARLGKSDHAGLPISPRELAETAAGCAAAGAAMIHLHVRDENGRHSLEPAHYLPAIRAIRQAVGEAILIQVTSEAAGIYTPQQQMHLIEALQPDGVSVAIREIFADAATTEAAAAFLAALRQSGSLVQYILYSPEDVRRYRQLVADGEIPAGRHWVLFVLGRYADAGAAPQDLDDYIAELGGTATWMACAFGLQAFDVLTAAAASGGHVRIGFENGWVLPDGRIAADNALLVGTMAKRLRDSGQPIATAAAWRAALTPFESPSKA